MSSAAVENGRPSSAARAMVVRAWRERWSDVQWGVRLKTVLHNGASTKASSSSSFPGDAANLSSVLLESALVGPAPNALVLGYLRHSLASRVVSRAALLRAVAAVDDRWDRPHCSSALVDLAAAAADRCEGSLRPSRGEDPVALSTALLHLLWWLLRLAAASLEAMEKSRRASAIGGSSPAEGTIDRANYKRSLDLARALVGGDLTQALLYVGKAEEKDTWSKVASACKMLGEQVKQSEFPSSSSFVKAEVSKLIASIKSLDPGRSSSHTSSSDAPMTGPPFSLSLILQPLVAFDAILHSSTSDQTSLGLRLYSSALTLNLSFSDLVFYLIRCSLFTVSQDTSIHSLKMDAFILVKLPGLLDQLASLMKADSGSALKTPTETYKALDRILHDESLLDAADLSCDCSIVDSLLRVVGRCSPALMTETEIVDVAKSRKSSAGTSASRLRATGAVPEDMTGGPTRNFEKTLKAEAMMNTVLSVMGQDKVESIENLLGVICLMVSGESFDRLLAASSANGLLESFVRGMVRFNQQSQESQGESVKNSLLRAALFDITFLMLVRVVHCFGREVVLREAGGTLIETWVREVMLEEGGRAKAMMTASSVNGSGGAGAVTGGAGQQQQQQQQEHGGSNTVVDTLLQQLHNGDLRTQVVRWQNACLNVHLATREMVSARSANALDGDTYRKMMKTACSKLCALPVCVAAWILGGGSRASSAPPPQAFRKKRGNGGSSLMDWPEPEELMEEFSGIVEEGRAEAMAGGDMPHAKERTDLMNTILKEMREQGGYGKKSSKKKSPEHNDDSTLSKRLSQVWSHVKSLGHVDIESVRILQDLFHAGGASWFVSCLLDQLISVAHEDELHRQSDLVIGIMTIDLEKCTLALLLDVLPSRFILTSAPSSGRGAGVGYPRLADPHGAVLARVAAACVFNVLLPHQMATKGKLGAKTGTKRSASEMADGLDLPASKISRLMDSTTNGSSGIKSEQHVKQEDSSSPTSSSAHPVSSALTALLRLVHEAVADPAVTPAHTFAIRFLEQCVRHGRSAAAAVQGGSGGRHLLQQHLRVETVLLLVRAAPRMFSVGLVTQLFDHLSPLGRRDMARVLCQLKSATQDEEAAEGKDKKKDLKS